MLKKVLVSAAIVALSFSACSKGNDPKATAIEVCEMAKTADLQGILPYIGDEKMKKELASAIVMMESFKNSDMGKKMIAQQLEKAKTIDCEKTTVITKKDDTTYSVGNKDTKQTFTLKLVDGSWKMFQ